ncbi:MAG TPA: galactokinase family protein [Gemmatimonadaceae bacterium]|nr:galactokinase family protein [Gemmatimonadaceae bacterium]
MTRTYVVPGRVELVGKHVDYGGGRSLTCAVDLTLRATARPVSGRVLRVHQRGSRDVVSVAIDASAQPTRVHWSTYAAAVARRLGRDFPHARGGVELWVSSDLPRSAGLSSSTALTIALARAVVDATGIAADPMFIEHAGAPIRFAEYVAAIETGAACGPFAADDGVGVRGGAQDHVAIICGRAGMVGQFSYIPAREEGWAPWPADQSLVIGVSGVHAAKTGNARDAYNRASDAVRWLVRQWNGLTYRNDPTLAAAIASAPDAIGRIERTARDAEGAPVSAAYLATRLAQFREECDVIVPGVASAFRAGDLQRLGALVDRSQALAERALENQVPETIHLARSARELGAVAASAFGAGFGGAVWAMVPSGRAEEFSAGWHASFADAFPARVGRARFVITKPGSPFAAE